MYIDDVLQLASYQTFKGSWYISKYNEIWKQI